MIKSMVRHKSTDENNVSEQPKKDKLFKSDISSSKIPGKMLAAIKSRRSSEQIQQKGIEQIPRQLSSYIKSMVFVGDVCKICERWKAKQQLINITNDECEHVYCLQCLQQYLIYKINLSEVLYCPQDQCDVQVDMHSLVFQTLPSNVVKRYKKFLLWKQNVNNANLKICPQENCQNGIIDLTQKYIRCSHCKVEFCPQCLMHKHEGNCGQHFQQIYGDWRRCPRCKVFIEKTQGCDHMTCKCGYEFDYRTLTNWNQVVLYGYENPFGQWLCFFRILLGVLGIILFPVFIGLVLAIGMAIFALFMVGCVIAGFFYPIYYACRNFYSCDVKTFIFIIFIPVMMPVGAVVGVGASFVLTIGNFSEIWRAFVRIVSSYITTDQLLFNFNFPEPRIEHHDDLLI